MSSLAQSRRNNLWFGTEERMDWFPTPNRGASTGAVGWESGGTGLNGSGWQLGSFGSARNYIFEWPGSSSQQASQLMKSYSDGVYGRGLIYFIDPLIYKLNLFPAMWAAPSMGIGYEGSSLVYGQVAVSTPTSTPEVNNLPIYSATYDLLGVSAGWRGKEDAVFLPIPAGYTLNLGAVYSASGSGGVFWRTQATNGALGTVSTLTPLGTTSPTLTNATQTSSVAGVWVWVGKSSSGAATVNLSALTARLTPTANPSPTIGAGPWVGGQGHSGCRFIGKPTEIKNTGIDGGQVGFAASFREAGSWLYG